MSAHSGIKEGGCTKLPLLSDISRRLTPVKPLGLILLGLLSLGLLMIWQLGPVVMRWYTVQDVARVAAYKAFSRDEWRAKAFVDDHHRECYPPLRGWVWASLRTAGDLESVEATAADRYLACLRDRW